MDLVEALMMARHFADGEAQSLAAHSLIRGLELGPLIPSEAHDNAEDLDDPSAAALHGLVRGDGPLNGSINGSLDGTVSGAPHMSAEIREGAAVPPREPLIDPVSRPAAGAAMRPKPSHEPQPRELAGALADRDAEGVAERGRSFRAHVTPLLEKAKALLYGAEHWFKAMGESLTEVPP
jgi:hypothetical protein